MTDTERLDWLENITKDGACPGLIFDDNGHWAVAFDGSQNVPEGEGPQDIATSFWIEAAAWRPTIREAIDAAMQQHSVEDSEPKEGGT